MRISDWSSDVCSSDLLREAVDVERVTVEDMQDAFERPISGRPVQEIERAAGTDPAFFQDTVIPAGAAGFLTAPGHAACLEALVQPPAGLPGLGDLDPRRANTRTEARPAGKTGGRTRKS